MKAIIEKQKEKMSLSKYIFWLNSMTTVELIKEFPNRFHILNAKDSQDESVLKIISNQAILWDLVKDYAKELSVLEAEEKDELREELKIAFNAGKTYQAVFDREWHSGKWNEEIDFKEWYNKYLKAR